MAPSSANDASANTKDTSAAGGINNQMDQLQFIKKILR